MTGGEAWAGLVFLLAALVLVGPAAWRIGRRGGIAKYAVFWLAIALVLALAYQWFGG